MRELEAVEPLAGVTLADALFREHRPASTRRRPRPNDGAGYQSARGFAEVAADYGRLLTARGWLRSGVPDPPSEDAGATSTPDRASSTLDTVTFSKQLLDVDVRIGMMPNGRDGMALRTYVDAGC